MSDRTLNVKNDRVAELERENARLAATLVAVRAYLEDNQIPSESDDDWVSAQPALAILSRSAPTTEAVKLGCDVCGKPHTHISTPGGFRFCDEHGGKR